MSDINSIQHLIDGNARKQATRELKELREFLMKWAETNPCSAISFYKPESYNHLPSIIARDCSISQELKTIAKIFLDSRSETISKKMANDLLKRAELIPSES